MLLDLVVMSTFIASADPEIVGLSIKPHPVYITMDYQQPIMIRSGLWSVTVDLFLVITVMLSGRDSHGAVV